LFVCFKNISPHKTTIGNPNIPPPLQFDDSIDSKDWSIMFASNNILKFECGEVLQSKNSPNEFLFRILSGSCRVEVDCTYEEQQQQQQQQQLQQQQQQHQHNSKTKVVALLGVHSVFGETSLFHTHNLKSSANVCADADGIVSITTASYLRELFVQNLSLGGRFFASLCIQLAKSLRAMEESTIPTIALSVATTSQRLQESERVDREFRDLFGYDENEGVLSTFVGGEMQHLKVSKNNKFVLQKSLNFSH
jgi:CRP-like cAMP-binding protein